MYFIFGFKVIVIVLVKVSIFLSMFNLAFVLNFSFLVDCCCWEVLNFIVSLGVSSFGENSCRVGRIM